MKKVFSVLVAVFVTFVAAGVGMGEAEARRMGGGGSFGMQRQSVAPKPAPSRQAAPTAPASPNGMQAPKRNWLGPIAGLAAGLGLASLMSHLGLGEGFANILMIAILAAAAIFVFKLLSRRQAPQQPVQYAGLGGAGVTPPEMARPFGGSGASGSSSVIPDGFDSEAFLRVAKLNFVRLQAANDAKNLEDIREFVSPEVFAEIKMQMDERGAVTQRTDVVTLDAELLEVVTEGNRHIVTVYFNGMIREEEGAAAEPFSEIWHLAKPIDGSRGWVVAGVQQIN